RPVAGPAIRRPRAGSRRGLESVRRARARRPRAALGNIALTRRGTEDGGRGLEAGDAVTGAVAGVRPVAGSTTRRPRAAGRRGPEGVGRALTRRTRAALGDVALARRGTADGGRGLEAVHAQAISVAGVPP